jgi:ABC-type multidrug transport system fused ATPase/permease subunit
MKRYIDWKFNLKLYFGLLKRYSVIVGALMVLVLIIEATHLADNFLFKLLIDKGTAMIEGSILRNQFVLFAISMAAIYLAMIASRVIMKFMHIHLINRLDAGIILDMKRKFFNHIISLSHNFHTTHKTGSLIARLTRCGGAVERITDVIIFNFLPLIFKLIIAALAMMYFNVPAGVISVVTVIVFVIYNLIMMNVQQKYQVMMNDAEDREKAHIGDMLSNIDSVKNFGKERNIQTRFKHISTYTKQSQIRLWDYYRWTDAIQHLILGLGAFFLVYFSIIAFLNNNLTLGSIVFIYTTFGSLIGSMWGFIHGMRNFYRAMADFEMLFRYAKIENEVKDLPHAKSLKIKSGKIEFQNVSFRYGKRKIFKDLNLTIPRHKKIAFVGHSGCGKTTLVKLLYRLYDLESGKILIDGRDIKNFKKESLRAAMSIVPQECALFDDTIYSNVAFSKPKANLKEIKKAAKFAQLDKIIEVFPNKGNTIVGERGVKLSGGEKQRVSIARAILANRKVLVLDEATSSLDSQTEHEIQRDLEKLMRGRTSIIIAHRLSTIMKADEIVVMSKGKIVQQGTHKQLIKKDGQYKKLWNLQKGGYIR